MPRRRGKRALAWRAAAACWDSDRAGIGELSGTARRARVRAAPAANERAVSNSRGDHVETVVHAQMLGDAPHDEGFDGLDQLVGGAGPTGAMTSDWRVNSSSMNASQVEAAVVVDLVELKVDSPHLVRPTSAPPAGQRRSQPAAFCGTEAVSALFSPPAPYPLAV